MKTVFVVTGTRPEAIKLAPLIHELKKHTDYETVHCHTCQHRELADDVFAFFRLAPDLRFGEMTFSEDLAELFEKVFGRLRDTIVKVRPVCIVVQGDTQSALAAALCGFYLKVPVCHVEAGLRTGSQFSPFPEELNRRAIASCSTLHFAPTKNNALALRNEGFPKDNIFVTGNTGIDALEMAIRQLGVDTASRTERRQVLVTMHRRENIEHVIQLLGQAIGDAATETDAHFTLVLHPNPKVARQIRSSVEEGENVQLLKPMPYGRFIRAILDSSLIITDSGGIQEEAAHLGRRLLVCRRETERVEGLKAGTIELMPLEGEGMKRKILEMLAAKDLPTPVKAYGDGNASEKIVEVVRERLL